MKSRALLIIMALSASLALAMFAAGCGGGGDDASDTPAKATAVQSNDDDDADPPKSEPDTNAFKDIAVKACMDSAEEEDVPEDMAQEYCDCAIEELLKNVDAEDLVEIGLSGDEDLPPELEDEMMNAVLECIDELMGE